jgi:hypothetical protein
MLELVMLEVVLVRVVVVALVVLLAAVVDDDEPVPDVAEADEVVVTPVPELVVAGTVLVEVAGAEVEADVDDDPAAPVPVELVPVELVDVAAGPDDDVEPCPPPLPAATPPPGAGRHPVSRTAVRPAPIRTPRGILRTTGLYGVDHAKSQRRRRSVHSLRADQGWL